VHKRLVTRNTLVRTHRSACVTKVQQLYQVVWEFRWKMGSGSIASSASLDFPTNRWKRHWISHQQVAASLDFPTNRWQRHWFSHQQVAASLDLSPTGESVINFPTNRWQRHWIYHQQVKASLIFPPTGGSVIELCTNRWQTWRPARLTAHAIFLNNVKSSSLKAPIVFS